VTDRKKGRRREKRIKDRGKRMQRDRREISLGTTNDGKNRKKKEAQNLSCQYPGENYDRTDNE
jgi:hypothetical protein